MADKGFNVHDLFVTAATHTYTRVLRKKNRLSNKIVLKDRKIASKRVHIERVMGLGKTFKILKKPMSRTETALATEIIQVCFYLCNFRNNIVPQDAKLYNIRRMECVKCNTQNSSCTVNIFYLKTHS